MIKMIKWLAAIAVVGALAGCVRTAPVDNIHTTVSPGHTEAQVRNAILKAGAQRQWIINDVSPGVLKARQQSRDHVAEALINYSATSYSITYSNSSNLLSSGGKIHKTYNRWVRNLDKDIQVNLSLSATQ